MATDTTKGGSAKKSVSKKAAANPAAATSAPAPMAVPAAAKKTPRKASAAASAAAMPAPKPVKAAKAKVGKAITTLTSSLATAAAPQAPDTSVLVKADAGYGNAFFLRGSGPGLSWDKGVAMQCVAGDEWLWSTSESSGPFEVKVLLNDELWQVGPNTLVKSGEKCVIEPQFP